MSTPETMALAAAPLRSLVGTITPDDLARPTPCAEYDIAGLVNHLLYWSPGLAAAGRRAPAPPLAPAEADTLPLGTGFADTLRDRIDDMVAAWSEPRAWQGDAEFAGAVLPAPLLGGMAAGELVIHGWDLARALDRELRWDEGLLEYLYEQVSATAEQGRQMGAYGPPVEVAERAPVVDRLLAATGRAPDWAPSMAR